MMKLFPFLLFVLALASSRDMHAALALSEEPVCVISGERSLLDRPEGVAFSHDGKCIAVASSDGYSVTLHPCTDERGGSFASEPSQILRDVNVLRYPHDLEFTPCGRFLAVASRDNNSIVFYQYHDGRVNPEPHFIHQHPTAHLNLPAGLSFRKDDEVMGIANRAGLVSLTFYDKIGEGRYATAPCCRITDDVLRGYDLSAPHAIAFAPDGRTFSVVHKRVCGNSPGKSALAVWDAAEMRPIFISWMDYECVHSISYHPSGKFIAVTNERADVMLFEETEPLVFRQCASIGVDRRGYFEGPKGVAFSPCGQFLAITTMWPGVLIYGVEVIP